MCKTEESRRRRRPIARVSPLSLIETRRGSVKMSLRPLIYSSSSPPFPSSPPSSPSPRLNTPVTDNYGCAHSTPFHLSISVQSLSSGVFQARPWLLHVITSSPVSCQPLTASFNYHFLPSVRTHTFFFFVPALPLLSPSSPPPITLSQCSSRSELRERHLRRRAAIS